MNREEAIKIINSYDIGFCDLSGEKIPADKLVEAFDMATEALKDRPSEYNTISIANEPYTTEYAKGYNDAKREIALSGEYERAYQRGKADAIEALQTDIVRCGSCIHGQKILKAKEDVACDIWGGIWTENGFCSCGERRENENGVDS